MKFFFFKICPLSCIAWSRGLPWWWYLGVQTPKIFKNFHRLRRRKPLYLHQWLLSYGSGTLWGVLPTLSSLVSVPERPTHVTFCKKKKKKKKISISKESGWILKVSKFSKYCIYAPKWYFIRACSICMYSHDIFRGFCKAMWFILLATTFWKWSKNGNSEGPNVCQAQLNICLGRALSI